MYGIILWLSAASHSALIVTDGGTNLSFGRCQTKTSSGLAVGDLVFVKNLCPGQDEFNEGLSLVASGFWPEVAQVVSTFGALAKCQLLKTSGRTQQILAVVEADNQSSAPVLCQHISH